MKIVFDHNNPYLIPNALHPDVLSYILSERGGHYDDTEALVRKKFGVGWHVYNSSFRNYFEELVINTSELKSSDKWIYPVEIFGDFKNSFGMSLSKKSLYYNWDFTRGIPQTTMSKLKSSKGAILITMVHEGLVTNEFFERLHIICSANKLNPNKVILVTSGNYGITRQYNKFCRNNKITSDRISTLNYHYFLYEKGYEYNIGVENFEEKRTQGRLGSVSEEEFLESLGKKRKHNFLSFNRRMHPHRAMLVSEFLKYKLLDKNLVSFQFSLRNDFKFPKRIDSFWNEFLQIYDSLEHYEKELKPHIEEVVKRKKNMIDHHDLSHVHGFRYDTKKPFCDTYYSIVTESNFFVDTDYITEKTWKCVGNYHPFIMFGRPGTMSELKKLGFKTFEPYIDESYDKIRDNKKRYKAIVNEVLRLEKMTTNEWKKWYSDMKEILIHNKNHFMDLGKSRDEQFKKLFENIEKCIK